MPKPDQPTPSPDVQFDVIIRFRGADIPEHVIGIGTMNPGATFSEYLHNIADTLTAGAAALNERASLPAGNRVKR